MVAIFWPFLLHFQISIFFPFSKMNFRMSQEWLEKWSFLQNGAHPPFCKDGHFYLSFSHSNFLVISNSTVTPNVWSTSLLPSQLSMLTPWCHHSLSPSTHYQNCNFVTTHCVISVIIHSFPHHGTLFCLEIQFCIHSCPISCDVHMQPPQPCNPATWPSFSLVSLCHLSITALFISEPHT